MSVNIISPDLRPLDVSFEVGDIFEVGAKYHPSMRAKSRRPSFLNRRDASSRILLITWIGKRGGV